MRRRIAIAALAVAALAAALAPAGLRAQHAQVQRVANLGDGHCKGGCGPHGY